MLAESLDYVDNQKAEELRKLGEGLSTLKDVSKALGKFVRESKLPVVLIIDGVDKASNNQLLLSFLGMLRNKYILANDDMDYTFHSVILAGVHDIKNLKLSIRPEEERILSSI